MSLAETLQLPDFNNQSLIDGIESLDGVTEEAAQEGTFAELPKTTQEIGKGPLYRRRIKTARKRLFLLSYLKSARGGSTPGRKFKMAVREFQSDCGDALKTDGLLGPKTWQALNELVSFEDDTNLDRWWAHPHVLERALRLRLSSLGFLMTPSAQIQHGLERFVATYNAYFAEGQPLTEPFSRETYTAIFDLDSLTSRIAAADPEILMRPALRAFLICISKIELWLLGYDIAPDGIALMYQPSPPKLFNDMPLPPDVRPSGFLPFLKGSLAKAMQRFWVDLGTTRKEAREKSGTLDLTFFKNLHNVDVEADLSTSDIADHLLKTPKAVPGVISAITSIGNRLFDGIKRAANWIANLIRRGIQKVSAFAKTIGRLLYHSSIKAFSKVRSFFTGFKLSLELLMNRTLPGSSGTSLALERYASFNVRMAIDQNLSDTNINENLDIFSLVTKIFRQCTQIFKSLILLFINTAQAAIKGFAGLVFALVRFLPRIKSLATGLTYNDELIDQLKTLKASLNPASAS